MRLLLIALLPAFLLFGCATQTVKAPEPIEPKESYIAIFPGEKVYVEVVIENNAVQFTKVAEITKPETTLVFEFTASNAGVLLAGKNPLDQSLKYHINMVDLKGNLHPTSSCPLMAKLGSFETWPHPIPELRISAPHVVTDVEIGLCVY